MDILIEPDCYKVCRICMESCEDDFVCIYDEFEDNILMDVITECARVEIRRDDALPRNACRNCAEYMIIAYHIVQKCRDSDQTLRSIFKHEIDLQSRKNEENIFCGTTDLHPEDINPAEYEFLLSEAYNNMMLGNVEGLIGEAVERAPLEERLRCSGRYQQEQETALSGSGESVSTNNADCVKVEHGETHEDVPPETEQLYEAFHNVTMKCCGCKKEFRTETELQTHCDLIHLNESINVPDTGKPFKCSVCFKSFSNQQVLKEHQRSAIRKFFCRQCGKGFMTQINLDNHLKCHASSPETRKCCGCRKDFESESRLQLHSLQEHKPDQSEDPNKPFECNICYQCAQCGEIFMKKIFLTAHEHTCHPEEAEEGKKKRCCGCRLEFASQRELLEHAAAAHKPSDSHHDEEKRPFECEICRKHFNSKINLHQHQKKSAQEKRYACDICGRCFSRAHDKTNHETTHSNEMPFACHICSRRFKNKMYLKTHYKLHLIGDLKEFVCHECGKCFRTKDLLKTHSISHSEERKFACSICPAKFKRMQCLKVHSKVHTREKAFACTICDKRYIQSSDLKRHMLKHNTGEAGKPFQCEYCLKRYPRKDYLKVHIRKQHLEKADMILIEDMAIELQGDEEDFCVELGAI